jgi:hypothetical protein
MIFKYKKMENLGKKPRVWRIFGQSPLKIRGVTLIFERLGELETRASRGFEGYLP